ncbi:MAG TPA: sulfatase-like hydrolase/transferase [Steroidobacteraceae bacterium]
MKNSAPRWHDGFLLTQVLALSLLVLSYLRTIGDSQSMAFRSHILDALYAGPIWGTKLGYNLLFFALSVVLVHVLYGLVCWGLGRLSARAWPSAKTTLRQHLLLWFLLLTAGVLANNAATFSQSALGQPYAETMTALVLGTKLGHLIWIGVLSAGAVTVALAGFRWWSEGGRPSRPGYVAMGAASVAYIAVTAHSILPAKAPELSGKPNVILIGLDSLREDLVDEKFSPHATPHLAAFMKDGTWFSNAMTPLARTFPSMCAMFTGRRPHHSGAVMNLLPRNLIDDSESLPRILARAGYKTVYATDEVRFANIDESFGFVQTITPPIGATEFMIEKVADAPVTNLLVNTRLGRWLFPHVHANRGAAITYDPNAFVERIDRELSVNQPLFFNVHLTLDHWPYTWAGSPIKKKDETARWPPYYLHAARRVDQQLGDIMTLLERRGLLRDAIVVVYSDHGESFDAPHEALVPDDDPLIKELGLDPLWGHGTSVISAHQYRIVLGMRRYGADWQAGREFGVPVSFEDIAPTLVETLGLAHTARFDGRSLAPLLAGQKGAERGFAGRIRFTETEYQLPAGFATQDGDLSPSKVAEAIAVYSVDRKTDRITVKKSHLGGLLLAREYAAIGEQNLVAAFPKKKEPGFFYLAIPLSGGAPRQLLSAPAPDEPELHALWNALHTEYGDAFQLTRQPVATSTVANRERTIPQNVTK